MISLNNLSKISINDVEKVEQIRLLIVHALDDLEQLSRLRELTNQVWDVNSSNMENNWCKTSILLESYEEKPIGITLPQKAICTVEETEPVVKGQTAASSYKPAMLDNGVRVMVPPFVDAGEKIVVDTGELTYVERAK